MSLGRASASTNYMLTIASRLICLIATVFMLYKARSEFVPLWMAPFVLLAYPFLVLFQAVVDIYGQAYAAVM